MELLLSGAESPGAEQKDVNKSLGGYVSSSKVQNNSLNFLFSSISFYERKYSDEEIIGIFIHNGSETDLQNLKIQVFYDEKFGEKINQTEFSFAGVIPNGKKIESISSKTDFPLNANFFECESFREYCFLEFNEGLENDVNVNFLEKSFTLKSGDIESLIKQLQKEFKNSNEYRIEKHSFNKIYIKNIKGVKNTNDVFIKNSSNEKITTTSNFSNGVDGSVELASTLASDEHIGLWIKRTIVNNEENPNKVEKSEIVFTFD